MAKNNKNSKNSKETKELAVKVTPQLVADFGNSKTRIDNIMQKAVADLKQSRMDVAVELAKIDTAGSYAAGNFKSIKECAASLLAPYGVKDATAWQLARVGKRFLLEQSELHNKLADMFPPSLLAELTNMTDAQIEYELEHGGITENSTQKELREVAKTAKNGGGEGKGEVVTLFDIKGYILDYVTGNATPVNADGVTKEVFIDGNVGGDAAPTGIKLDGDKASATRHMVAWSKANNKVAIVQYAPHINPDKVAKAGPVKTKVLDDETRAAIDALPAAQRAAVLRAMGMD